MERRQHNWGNDGEWNSLVKAGVQVHAMSCHVVVVGACRQIKQVGGATGAEKKSATLTQRSTDQVRLLSAILYTYSSELSVDMSPFHLPLGRKTLHTCTYSSQTCSSNVP